MFKQIAIAATVIALSASTAYAGFGHQDSFDEGDRVVRLDLVRAAGAGTVVLESLRGDVIGTARVQAGSNSNVLVNVRGRGVQNDVIAKLVINGRVTDRIRIQTKR